MKYLSIAQTAERLGHLPSRRIQTFVRRWGACPGAIRIGSVSGDSRGRREASGRENQERKVYQEARRKWKNEPHYISDSDSK